MESHHRLADRDGIDPHVWSNVPFIIAAGIAAGRRMYLLALALLVLTAASTTYHRTHENKYMAADMAAVGAVVGYGVVQIILPKAMKPGYKILACVLLLLMLVMKIADSRSSELYEEWHPWFHVCAAFIAIVLALVGTPVNTL
jgi:hypothetical protein